MFLTNYTNYSCAPTNPSWHPGHDHELVRHRVDVVHVELADAVVQGGVEKVHEVNQL